MSTSGFAGGSTPDPGGGTAQGAGVKEQAQQAAGTAAEEGKHVAGVARGEATNVAAEAKTQAQSLLQQAGREVDTQSRHQKDRLVGTMRTLSDDLEQMASQGNSGVAAQLAQEVAQRTRSVSAHLEQREPRDLLDDVRDFARRKPGTFLLGALAAGVVVGRVARGAKDAQSRPAEVAAPGTATSEFGPPITQVTPGLDPSVGSGAVLDPLDQPPLGTPDPGLDDPRYDPSEPGGRL